MTQPITTIKNYSLSALKGVGHIVAYPIEAIHTAACFAIKPFRQADVTLDAFKIQKNIPPEDTRSLAELRSESEKQKKIFLRTISAIALIEGISKSVCHIDTSKTLGFYENMLDKTASLTDRAFEAHIKANFFPLIKNAPISTFRKWSAYLLFNLLTPSVNNIIDSIFSRVLNDVRRGVENNTEKDKCQSIGIQYLSKFLHYLTDLCRAYKTLNNSSDTEDVNTLLETGLQQILAEQGFSQKELNKYFTKHFLASYPYKISTARIVDMYMRLFEIPQDSYLHFLNPVVRLVCRVVSWVLKAILMYPLYPISHILESLLTRACEFSSEQILENTDLLGNLVGSVVETIKKADYAHTLHSNIQGLIENSVHLLENSAPVASNVKLEYVTGIMERLFLLLELSRKRDRNEVEEHAEDHRNVLEKWLDRLIADNTPELLNAGFEQLVNPLQVEKLILSGLSSLNTLYDKRPPLSPEKIQEKEKEIIELKDKLQQFIISKALQQIPTGLLGTNMAQSIILPIAHANLKRRTDAIFDSFLLQPHHYNQGLINRLVLLPFIEARTKQ